MHRSDTTPGFMGSLAQFQADVSESLHASMMCCACSVQAWYRLSWTLALAIWFFCSIAFFWGSSKPAAIAACLAASLASFASLAFDFRTSARRAFLDFGDSMISSATSPPAV